MKSKEETATITLWIPDELKAKLDKLPEVNWSAFMKGVFIKKVKQLKKFEQLVREGKI